MVRHLDLVEAVAAAVAEAAAAAVVVVAVAAAFEFEGEAAVASAVVWPVVVVVADQFRRRSWSGGPCCACACFRLTRQQLIGLNWQTGCWAVAAAAVGEAQPLKDGARTEKERKKILFIGGKNGLCIYTVIYEHNKNLITGFYSPDRWKYKNLFYIKRSSLASSCWTLTSN